MSERPHLRECTNREYIAHDGREEIPQLLWGGESCQLPNAGDTRALGHSPCAASSKKEGRCRSSPPPTSDKNSMIVAERWTRRTRSQGNANFRLHTVL